MRKIKQIIMAQAIIAMVSIGISHKNEVRHAIVQILNSVPALHVRNL